MRFLLRRVMGVAVVCGIAACAAAQTAPKPAPRPLQSRSYCHPAFDFCFKYPANWLLLGEVFDGHGVVVGPSQKGDRENWDVVTVALMVPPPQGEEEPISIGSAIVQAEKGARESGISFETLQRQQRTVDGNPAEMLKVRYTDKATGREWVEELFFIEGPESEIYSVALKTAPAALPQMEAPFLRIVDSWKLPQATAPPDAPKEGTAKPSRAPSSQTGQPKSTAPANPKP